jgi:hypothetical protein
MPVLEIAGARHCNAVLGSRIKDVFVSIANLTSPTGNRDNQVAVCGMGLAGIDPSQCVQLSTWCSLWLYIEGMLSAENARRVRKDEPTI